MVKNDGGVAEWSLCSRTPHDETVLGGRAQLGPSQLARENDGSLRPSLGRSASRRARGGRVRTVAILTILRDEMLSFVLVVFRLPDHYILRSGALVVY